MTASRGRLPRRRMRRPAFVDRCGVAWLRVITDERYEWRKVGAA
jgi:hypothetical protein